MGHDQVCGASRGASNPRWAVYSQMFQGGQACRGRWDGTEHVLVLRSEGSGSVWGGKAGPVGGARLLWEGLGQGHPPSTWG